MLAPAACLAVALLLPLFAMILHGLAPSVRGSAEAVQARNAAQARAALYFQWTYGAFLVWLSIAGFCSPEGLLFKGRGLPVGVTNLMVEPTLYLDGRNAPFLLLMGLALPMVFTWLRDKDGKYGPSYYVSANLLSLSLVGVFISDSLLLFYLFWETALIGAYFWIGMHGKSSIHAGSVYRAVIRFALITLLGSLPMLLSIVALCAAAGKDPGLSGIAGVMGSLSTTEREFIFAGFLLAFAVKLPLLGFHGWLRDAYNVAPPACRAILSAVMSKMGAYGLILVLGQGFKAECFQWAPQLQMLCVAGAVYGGLLCLAQDRLIDILVYSSLSHLSLVALGLFSAMQNGDVETTGMTGALFQVFNHGLIMAALFAFDARVSVNGESPTLSGAGGLRKGQRRLAAVLLVAVFASASLPGLSNFAGEILVLFSAFRSSPWLTLLASLGALITAAALVRAFHAIFLGVPKNESAPDFKQAPDFGRGETALALCLIALWLALGLYPMLFIHPVEKSILAVGASRPRARRYAMNPYVISQAPLVIGFALLLIVASFKPHQKENLSGILSILALAGSAVCIWIWLPEGSEYFGGAIRVTSVGRTLAYVCLALTVGAVLLSDEYLEKIHVTAVDWRMVVLAVGLGMVNLCLAGDLATLFISYELVSIPSYVLAGFAHKDPRSNEAGMKYLLLGAFTSVLFLLGLSFIYGATGEIHLLAIHDKLARAVDAGATADLTLAKVGLALILGAVFFKVAVAPFHNWLPDVYQGTNLASLAVISSPVKVAVFGMLGMLLWGAFEPLSDLWKPVLLGGAALSALMGNLQAIRQTSLKRLVAYSAVVNAGFILLGIMANSATIVIFYLGSYGIMTLGSWAAFMAMGTRKADVDELSDLAGLGRTHKWLALAMTIILLSYAGIPLTAGFAAKFGVLLEALRPDADLPRHTVQVLLLSVVGGLVSFYFYFQIVKAMWIQKPEGLGRDSVAREPSAPLVPEMRWNYVFVLAMSVVVIVSLGMFLRLPGL